MKTTAQKLHCFALTVSGQKAKVATMENRT
jgi:hypothetical protein